jgi:hypothetical protein
VKCSFDLPLQHKIFTLGTFDLEQSTAALSDEFTSPLDEDYKLIINNHCADFKFYIA